MLSESGAPHRPHLNREVIAPPSVCLGSWVESGSTDHRHLLKAPCRGPPDNSERARRHHCSEGTDSPLDRGRAEPGRGEAEPGLFSRDSHTLPGRGRRPAQTFVLDTVPWQGGRPDRACPATHSKSIKLSILVSLATPLPKVRPHDHSAPRPGEEDGRFLRAGPKPPAT